jgi:hypothetical protein
MATAGRKGAAFCTSKAGEQRTLAELTVTSGVVRRIGMTPASTWIAPKTAGRVCLLPPNVRETCEPPLRAASAQGSWGRSP